MSCLVEEVREVLVLGHNEVSIPLLPPCVDLIFAAKYTQPDVWSQLHNRNMGTQCLCFFLFELQSYSSTDHGRVDLGINVF